MKLLSPITIDSLGNRQRSRDSGSPDPSDGLINNTSRGSTPAPTPTPPEARTTKEMNRTSWNFK